ncbi:unnamed protein product [Linum trigynum]|uniref:Uncharacterized protein n=1 Tax=Linum trigynum TaxID=586398 RepID=A0AAV2FC07_9ROSI
MRPKRTGSCCCTPRPNYPSCCSGLASAVPLGFTRGETTSSPSFFSIADSFSSDSIVGSSFNVLSSVVEQGTGKQGGKLQSTFFSDSASFASVPSWTSDVVRHRASPAVLLHRRRRVGSCRDPQRLARLCPRMARASCSPTMRRGSPPSTIACATAPSRRDGVGVSTVTAIGSPSSSAAAAVHPRSQASCLSSANVSSIFCLMRAHARSMNFEELMLALIPNDRYLFLGFYR